MVTESKDRKVNTDAHVKNDGAQRLPSERDESPDAQNTGSRDVMQQAASDLEQGLVDTDLHGTPGQEKVAPAPAAPARPDAAKHMPKTR
jgi:hypothetical protein